MELEGWDKLVEINLNGVLYCMRAVLPAMRKQKDGCIINVASWAGRHVSKMPGPAYTTTKHAVLALTHSFNMDECVNGLRACCLSPGEVATPILKLRPVVPSEAEQARMLQPEDCGRTIAFVASMPPRVCMNEILISPTWNRGFIQTPISRRFTIGMRRVAAVIAGEAKQSGARGAQSLDFAAVRTGLLRNDEEARCGAYASPNSFKHHDNLFPKPPRKPPVARANDDDPVNRPASLFSSPADTRRSLNQSGDDSMSKRIALLSAAAFGALALTATIVAPVSAQEKTVMVGGAAMFPSKNIIQNAVNSKDHTTLVAAVKAAGLVETLEGKGPFTVFAPTNAAFGKLPAGTVDTLVKPENKATLTKILTYHVVPGKLEASDLTDGKKLKTVEGEELTVKKAGGKVMIVDCQGRLLDRDDLERQPVERRDPCGRHRADAGVVTPTRLFRAFSSEVDSGSRQENASNQESRAPFRFYRNGKGSCPQQDARTASRGNPARFFVTAIGPHAAI